MAEADTRKDEDALLLAIAEIAEGAPQSYAELAAGLSWLTKERKPNKTRVSRVATRLKKDKLVDLDRGHLALTSKGKAAAARLRLHSPDPHM